tara:strand:- start:3130 stop:4002 length:873 start_codon:yes stop_codon:yes gene_type:complete
MKKFLILIPVYDDWESLNKLLSEINDAIADFSSNEFSCIVVNDASKKKQTGITKPNNIKILKIINMKENRGHARCNAFGLRYIVQNENFDFLIVMDGDGEDRPEEIKKIIPKILSEKNSSVFAKRIKRSEGPIFQLLYKIHKILTFIFTGKNINFGNYSCLIKKDVQNISNKASLWSSFSGTLKKYIQNYTEIDSIRGKRYFGPSKMSLLNLLIHSFSIIAVFKKVVFFRSAILLILICLLSINLNTYFFLIFLLLLIFNIMIYLTSLRENQKDLENSTNNIKDINTFTQ